MIIKNISIFIIFVLTTISPISKTHASTTLESTSVGYDFLKGIESSVLVFSTHDTERFGGNDPVLGSAYQMIEEAKKTILVANYIFEDKTILELLNHKAQEGLDILVVADRIRCADLVNKLHPSIKFGTQQSDADGHMHHKYLVTDHSFVWLGGANFFSFPGVPNISLAFFSQKIAADIHNDAVHIVSHANREKETYPVENFDGQKLEVFILPHNDPMRPRSIEAKMNDAALKKVIKLINDAQESIEISMVVWTYKDVARSLAEAIKRGVKVKVAGALIEQEVRKLLANAGIPVKDVKGNYHHKYMVIDKKILWNGSANFSFNAFSRSDESFTVLYDLNQEQKTVMDGAWADIMSR